MLTESHAPPGVTLELVTGSPHLRIVTDGDNTPRPAQGRTPAAQHIKVRRALPRDVTVIDSLVQQYAVDRILLPKELVGYYEDVQEFLVAEDTVSGEVIGCGALHVMWSDLAEIRTLAVHPRRKGQGVGYQLVQGLLTRARELGLSRVFCLTFEIEFFLRQGFREIEGTPVTPEVYAELLRSHDDGVAEFLDLARVKPNTLGNARMLIDL